MASSFWSTIITFVLFVVLARLLSPTDFGVFALASTMVQIAGIISTAGLGSAIVREPEYSASFASTVFWTVLGLSIGTSTLMFVVAPSYARFVNAEQVVPVIQVLAVLLPLNTLSTVPGAVLTRAFQHRKLAIQGIVSSLSGGVGAIILALQGWGVWALVAQSFISGIVSVALLWFMCRWRPAMIFDRSRVWHLLVFGTSMMATQIVWMLLVRVQETFISRWHGTEAVGQYRIAWRLIELVSQSVLSPIGSVSLVTFSHVQHERERFKSIYRRMIGLAGTANFPALLGIGAVSPILLPLLFGEKWAPAIPISEVLVLMCVPFVLNFFAGPALNSINRPQANLWIALLQLALTVALTWIAVPYGLMAVAAAYVARAWITMIPQQIALYRHAGVSMRSTAGAVLPPLFAAVVMAGTVRVIVGPLVTRFGIGWESALASVALGLVLFPVVMTLIGHDPRREIRELLSTLRKRKKA